MVPLYGTTFSLYSIASLGSVFGQLHCGSTPERSEAFVLMVFECRLSPGVGGTLRKSVPGMCFPLVRLCSCSTFFVLPSTWKRPHQLFPWLPRKRFHRIMRFHSLGLYQGLVS